MKRLDRLFSILLIIQHHRRERAQDLAVRFGATRRNSFRDVAALNESGAPIVPQAGEGYELAEVFALPPLE